MLSNFHTQFFLVNQQSGCILTVQMKVNIWNNVQINGFWDTCDFAGESHVYDPRDTSGSKQLYFLADGATI